VGVDGSHLASTLHHLARTAAGNGGTRQAGASVFAQVANRLSELVENVHQVGVDEDRQRELLTLQVVDREGAVHAARALSDGTLRFLALAILEMDPGAQGLICFEEPENGIHPERIASMLTLLRDLCVDTTEPVGEDNPLRQVIVNTHSPAVVALVRDDDLLVAEPWEVIVPRKGCDGKKGAGDHLPCRAVRFSWLEDTWRSRAFSQVRPVSRGALRAYLNPFAFSELDEQALTEGETGRGGAPRLVKDREDLLPLFAQTADSARASTGGDTGGPRKRRRGKGPPRGPTLFPLPEDE